MKISRIEAMEVLDSRGNPTVQATVKAGKVVGTASVPSGASTGTHEALELRDNDKKRYLGKGVLKAVGNINGPVAKALKGKDAEDQKKLDSIMVQLDGTSNKSRLGANAILAVSMAAARLSANLREKELYSSLASTFGYKPKGLPVPMINVINGGAHADSGLDIQEYMIIPRMKKFSERLRAGAEVYHNLKSILKNLSQSVAVGDEGGFAPHLQGNEKPLEILTGAIRAAGYTPFKDIQLGLDVAASEFYNKQTGKYEFKADKKKRNISETVKLYTFWVKKYKLFSIEDGFAEDDFEGWKALTGAIGKNTTIVGDDLFVTNTARLKQGMEGKWANAILIKLNQIGTVSETVDAIKMAQGKGWVTIISNRSAETEDSFIADLAVAVNAPYIKTGSLARGERTAKYNRLLEIEKQLSKNNE